MGRRNRRRHPVKTALTSGWRRLTTGLHTRPGRRGLVDWDAGTAGPARVRLRRLATSRAVLFLVLGIALVAIGWLTDSVKTRGEAQVDTRGRAIAEVVATLLTPPDVGRSEMSSDQFEAEAFAEARSVVQRLRADRRLVGVAVWRPTGQPLFRDAEPGWLWHAPTAGELRRTVDGKSWTARGRGPSEKPVLHVFLPLRPAGHAEPVEAVLEVLISEDETTRLVNDSLTRQQVATLLLFLGLISGFVWLRRGLIRRDRQARQDPLTGLLNRRALFEDADVVLAKATAAHPVGLLLIDLQEFKSVNDTLGHGAGDRLLQQVAATLRYAVRSGDLVIRLGGDEFAILLADLPSEAAASQRAEELLRRLRDASFSVHGIDLLVDASVGVAIAPQHGSDVPVLLQRADVAMYEAKRHRSGTALYDAGVDQHTVGRLELLTQLRRALEHDEFLLLYQPKVSLPGQRISSVEALVRWRHPTRGLLGPGEFLPLAEDTGLMQPLTRWVLRTAIHQAASWQRAGMPLQVAVNISPRSLVEGDLPARVLAMLLAADLPAPQLQLEITETAVMTDPQRAAVVLGQLAARGVEIAIDDFGAGYTSLAHLRSLPITALKIDRSLVSHMLECAEDATVTEALIDLGHRLDFKVIAEGVEADALVRRLTELGCDQAQGYAISAPLRPAALEGWLAERRTGQAAASAFFR